MVSDSRDASMLVDATDGGYILASFASPPVYEWAPTDFADEPGQVAVDGHVATINALGIDEDERVLLSCLLLNRPPSQSEVLRRIGQGAHMARFSLEAAGPILVMANDLDEQGVIAEALTSSIQLDCCVFMVTETDKLYPDDPVEQHHMRMWPSNAILRARPWWMG